MSNSESEESMVTSGPVEYVDMKEEGEEESRDVGVEGAVFDQTTVITQEEIETMLKCTMRAMDSNNEVMNILLQLNRMCGLIDD